MGYMQAMEMAGAVANGETNLNVALHYHLRANHYPPLPVSLIPTCKEVIEKANDNDYYAEVELPEGILFRGRTTAPVHECIRAWHLEAFIEGCED